MPDNLNAIRDAKDKLAKLFTEFPHRVTAIGIGLSPLARPLPEQRSEQSVSKEPGSMAVAESQSQDLLVFVEPAADCELDHLQQKAEEMAGMRVRILVTGRFTGLISTLTVGQSISSYRQPQFNLPEASAGTFGAVATISRMPGKQYILGSNHVFAHNGRVKDGTPIVLPGTLDGAVQVIGHLSYSVRLVPAKWPPPPSSKPLVPPNPPLVPPSPRLVPPNDADCALAEVTAGVTAPNNPIRQFPNPDQVNQPVPVTKIGRTTKKTSSEVRIKALEGYVDLQFGSFYFENLLGVVGNEMPQGFPFAAQGDSGALVITNAVPPEALGLVTARAYSSEWVKGIPLIPGSGPYDGYIVGVCPINRVVERLAREVANKLGPGAALPNVSLYI
jgi:hypothetical protein